MSHGPIWEMPDYLAEFIAEEPDAGKDLIDTFIEDTAKQLASLRTALAATDMVQTGRLLHSLKGSSSQIGALRLSGACADAEAALASGDVAALANGVNDVGVFREQAVALMSERLSQGPNPA